jgi:dihydrofolate synthase/folylpolyglutamate synthase
LAKVRPALYGPHQLKNTALVLKAASIFRQNGLYVSAEAVRKGVESTDWPGRFQLLTGEGRPIVVLDVAHNPGGLAAFVETFKLKFPNRKAVIIAGFVRKKDHQKMFELLSKVAREYYLVPLKSRRSMAPSELLDAVDFRGLPVTKASSVTSVFNRLTKAAGSDDIICVVGSHYLVGEFLAKFGEKWARLPDRKKIPTRPKVRPNRSKALPMQF